MKKREKYLPNTKMFEHRPSDLLNTHLDRDGDGNSSSAYNVQNRQVIISEIKQALQGCELNNIAHDYDQLQGLCELSIKETESLEKKSHFADLALCFVDNLKHHLSLLDQV
jgi:hypothetical protein